MGIDINNQGLYLKDAIKKILEEMDTLIVNNEILHKEEINLEGALGKFLWRKSYLRKICQVIDHQLWMDMR